ncbi:MAG: hypothetical protein HDT39_08040 [Lachnospiraceae bacterium]|nr:hypothetical protein [Lachnospiraceae bacterium]
MAIVTLLVGMNLNQIVFAETAVQYVTLYFVDNTAEQWIKDDNAMIKAIDNTNGHESYWMTQVNEILWETSVPMSAYNITFNRCSPDKTTQWNSWSTGGRDGNSVYYAEGSEYGHWGVFEEKEMHFHAGDIIYLDVSEFTAWKNDNVLMYVNFNNASKEQNSGNDISLLNADKELYNPKGIKKENEDYIYSYEVSPEDEGSINLRFWREDLEKLWNCSAVLSYEDYLQGLNCVKVTEWDNGSLVHRESDENENTGLHKWWKDMKDTDGDGLPDSYEEEIGTDIANPDTDGDGLPDGFEVLYASSNPLKWSTLENGVSDADLDIDEDGLTMLQEYLQGTDPLESDTDNDGLKKMKYKYQVLINIVVLGVSVCFIIYLKKKR